MSVLRLEPEAVIADLDELAAQSGGRFAGAKRLAWTPQWLEARSWLRSKLAEVGLDVEQDPAGNLWASVDGEREEFLIVGSHIDAVPNGGWLDGALGLLTALETVRQLVRSGRRPPIGVRFVDWADEEGARFGRSLLGSSACAGTLDPNAVRTLTDADGVALPDALAACGVDLDSMAAAQHRLSGAVAYLELHIEQGPVLLDSARPAAAVSGTVGVERRLVSFDGQSSHAGSTPMHLRRDSLSAAARAALAIRTSAVTRGGVATVGQLRSTPGVITAVAGHTEMQLDQRHLDPDRLAEMLADARQACQGAADEFMCSVSEQAIFAATPTPFDPALVAIARASIARAGGGDTDPVPSGPLHDATEIGRLIPTAMIFAQSDPPVSHVNVENSPVEALGIAINAYGFAVEAVLAGGGRPAATGATRR